jgi:hypothetical protein
MSGVYGPEFTRNASWLVVLAPGVYRRFYDGDRVRSFLRYYRAMGGAL